MINHFMLHSIQCTELLPTLLKHFQTIETFFVKNVTQTTEIWKYFSREI